VAWGEAGTNLRQLAANQHSGNDAKIRASAQQLLLILLLLGYLLLMMMQ